MSRGPLPAELVFLNDLPQKSLNSKVRFLGCIVLRDEKAGFLHLQHVLSKLDHGTKKVTVVLDVSALDRRTLFSDLTTIGSWVNVVGYVTKSPETVTVEVPVVRNLRKTRPPQSMEEIHVGVQCVDVWSAGSIDLQAYETALRDLLNSHKTVP